MSPIPPIPAMTVLDEEWIDWAAGTYAMRREVLRGMLAALYTMRAQRLALGIEHIQQAVRNGEASLAQLPEWMERNPKEVELDTKMWNDLLPQLRELAR